MKWVESLAAEPDGLKAYRAQLKQEGRTPNWSTFRDEEPDAYRELREALIRTQHGLCAYCEINIHDTSPSQVEHYLPKSKASRNEPDFDRQLDFRNHLACCMGGTSRTTVRSLSEKRVDGDDYYHQDLAASQSCGDAKKDHEPGNAVIDPRCLQLQHKIVVVRPDGTIHPDKAGCAASGISVDHVRSTIDILKLDCYRLTYARKKWWETLRRKLPRQSWKPALLPHVFLVFLAPNSNGWLERFFSTTRSYLQPAGAEAWLALHSTAQQTINDGL